MEQNNNNSFVNWPCDSRIDKDLDLSYDSDVSN